MPIDHRTREGISEVVEGLAHMTQELAKNDEFFVALATTTKKHFEALKEVGFTEEQAFEIVKASATKGVSFNKN